jgi:F-type H+-transporting ATPase subunit delta
MADKNTLARPYATAIFELARESNALAELSEALEVAKELLSDGRVAKVLRNPALSDDARLSFVTELFGAAAGKASVFAGGSEHGTNFLKLLIEYGRVPVLPEIAEHFNTLKADVENTINVTVTSAVPLSPAQQKSVVTALKSRLGREVSLETRIDEGLIGGAVIRAGDVVIDGSLRSRLDGLANALVA